TWTGLLDAAQEEIARFTKALPQTEPSYTMSIEAVAYRTNPGAADWNAPVSRVLRDSIEDITGRAPDAYPNHYAGDIRYPIRMLGVPAYGIGSIGGNFYGPNEWVDIDDLVNLVAVLVQTSAGWSEL
ncbi:MAG: M20/M25/M40 family metallo-hydrolase, partial [Woeseia sp.]